MQPGTERGIVDRVAAQLGLTGTHLHFNSGVFAVEASVARDFCSQLPFLIGELAEHINFGDQGFFNLAAWHAGVASIPLDSRVNMAMSPNDEIFQANQTICLNGVTPWVYHFLGYKPGPDKRPETPNERAVQAFYECWHA